jgi:hypothetical protein
MKKNMFLKYLTSAGLLIGLAVQTAKGAQVESPGLLGQFWSGAANIGVPIVAGQAGSALGSRAIGYGRQALGIAGQDVSAGAGVTEPGFVQKWLGTGLTERIGGRTTSALAERAARGWLSGTTPNAGVSDVVTQSIGAELGASVGSRFGAESMRAAQTRFGDPDKPWALRLGEGMSIPAETIASGAGSFVGNQLGGMAAQYTLSGAGERVGSWLLGKTPEVVQRWAREYPNLATGIAVTTTLLAACAAATAVQGKADVVQAPAACPTPSEKKELLKEVLAENAAERGLTPEQAAREFYDELVEKNRLSLVSNLSSLDLEALTQLREVWLDVHAAYLSDQENVDIDFVLMYELDSKGVKPDDVRKSRWDPLAQLALILRKTYEESVVQPVSASGVSVPVPAPSMGTVNPAISQLQRENAQLAQEIRLLQERIRKLAEPMIPEMVHEDQEQNIFEQPMPTAVSSESIIKPFVAVTPQAAPISILTNEELWKIYRRMSSSAGRDGIRKDTQLLARIRASARAKNRMANDILRKLRLPV